VIEEAQVDARAVVKKVFFSLFVVYCVAFSVGWSFDWSPGNKFMSFSELE